MSELTPGILQGAQGDKTQNKAVRVHFTVSSVEALQSFLMWFSSSGFQLEHGAIRFPHKGAFHRDLFDVSNCFLLM